MSLRYSANQLIAEREQKHSTEDNNLVSFKCSVKPLCRCRMMDFRSFHAMRRVESCDLLLDRLAPLQRYCKDTAKSLAHAQFAWIQHHDSSLEAWIAVDMQPHSRSRKIQVHAGCAPTRPGSTPPCDRPDIHKTHSRPFFTPWARPSNIPVLCGSTAKVGSGTRCIVATTLLRHAAELS